MIVYLLLMFIAWGAVCYLAGYYVSHYFGGWTRISTVTSRNPLTKVRWPTTHPDDDPVPFDPNNWRTWPIPASSVETRHPDGSPARLSNQGNAWCVGFEVGYLYRVQR